MGASDRKEKALQAAAVKTTPTEVSDELFEDIFNRHSRLVFRSAYRVTGNASDAEDVMQTVFLKLLKRTDLPDLGRNPEGYMHRAGVNAALDLIRSRKSSNSVSLEDVVLQPRDDSPGPDDRHRAAEIRRWLRQAVAGLNATAAEMFVLRYIEGYGNREIAEIMETSQGTVAVTLHRARSRLQELIGEILKRN